MHGTACFVAVREAELLLRGGATPMEFVVDTSESSTSGWTEEAKARVPSTIERHQPLHPWLVALYSRHIGVPDSTVQIRVLPFVVVYLEAFAALTTVPGLTQVPDPAGAAVAPLSEMEAWGETWADRLMAKTPGCTRLRKWSGK